MVRARVAAVADVLSALVLVVWVGGHGALGAFAARIAFQELERPLAARTMARVFHEFDHVILVAVALLLVSALAGFLARPGGTRSGIRLGLELGLCALGLFEVLHVHALIEALFAVGDTQGPAFHAAHTLSERCAHAELLLVVACFAARSSWRRGA